jgi:hypothetical protein
MPKTRRANNTAILAAAASVDKLQAPPRTPLRQALRALQHNKDVAQNLEIVAEQSKQWTADMVPTLVQHISHHAIALKLDQSSLSGHAPLALLAQAQATVPTPVWLRLVTRFVDCTNAAAHQDAWVAFVTALTCAAMDPATDVDTLSRTVMGLKLDENALTPETKAALTQTLVDALPIDDATMVKLVIISSIALPPKAGAVSNETRTVLTERLALPFLRRPPHSNVHVLRQSCRLLQSCVAHKGAFATPDLPALTYAFIETLLTRVTSPSPKWWLWLLNTVVILNGRHDPQRHVPKFTATYPRLSELLLTNSSEALTTAFSTCAALCKTSLSNRWFFLGIGILQRCVTALSDARTTVMMAALIALRTVLGEARIMLTPLNVAGHVLAKLTPTTPREVSGIAAAVLGEMEYLQPTIKPELTDVHVDTLRAMNTFWSSQLLKRRGITLVNLSATLVTTLPFTAPDVCIVCFDATADPDDPNVFMPCCKKVLAHHSCIKPWFDKSSQCPHCRKVNCVP